MIVRLLGTGSAEGMPALFCRCETCLRVRKAGGKNIRTRSSALIDDVLKIDFPPDILSQIVAHDVDLAAMRAVLFTHGHDDHYCASELQYRGVYFVVPPVSTPLQIFGPCDLVESLQCLLNAELVSFDLHELEPHREADVIGYRVLPFVANHDPSQVCLNYVVTGTDGARLLYASDTGWYPDETWRMLEGLRFDAAVVECTKRDEGGYPGHLSVPEVIRMRSRLVDAGALAADSPVIATHFAHQMDLLHDELDALLSPHGITPAFDGFTLQVKPAV